MFLPFGYALTVAIVGAAGAVAGATALETGRKIGSQIEPKDLLPALPPLPPLPRFLFTKPEILAEMRRK